MLVALGGVSLAIEDQLEAYVQGGGQMDEIPDHPDELERHFENYSYMKVVCAMAAEARQAAKAANAAEARQATKAASNEPWPF
jgi:hypothetical protein